VAGHGLAWLLSPGTGMSPDFFIAADDVIALSTNNASRDSTTCIITSPGNNAEPICSEGGSGLLLPRLAPAVDPTQDGPDFLPAMIYMVLLLYCFVGVGIISDVFMGSIERITSKKIAQKDGKHIVTAKVWNGTVANLTLMALGSSAPEILLNVVGIFPNFQASELGPSTIVGSAAFNLLIIIPVCIIAIPDGEVRRIKYFNVYGVTAFFSIFAYLWLLVILLLWTPNVVTVEEGLITFLFFPVLVGLAFCADKMHKPTRALQKDIELEEVGEMEQFVRNKYGKGRFLSPEETALLIKYEFPPVYSRAVYRSTVIKGLTGGGKFMQRDPEMEHAEELVRTLVAAQVEFELDQELSSSDDEGDAHGTSHTFISFDQLVWTFMASAEHAVVRVRALGEVKGEISVAWQTRDGSAIKGSTYVETSGTVTFTPEQKEAEIVVDFVHANCDDEADEMREFEETKFFYVDLTDIKGDAIGKTQTATITMVHAGKELRKIVTSEFGEIRFRQEQVVVKGATCAREDIPLNIDVVRVRAAQGTVSCKWKTESDSALEGADFVAGEGIITFGPLETEKTITVYVKPNTSDEKTEIFRVILFDIEGGAMFDEFQDGGSDSCVLTVTIEGEGDGGASGFVGLVDRAFNVNWDQVNLGKKNYGENFQSAVFVGGSGEEDNDWTLGDLFMHILTLPWKLLFAFVPPTEFCGGWLCFFCSMFMIGVVTAFIGDVAEMLGCALGIANEITAITIVALGTSLPDTFASRTAALWESTADNSVGNVTGSNSVNVFLGLGLPWTICSLVWFFRSCPPDSMWHQQYGREFEDIVTDPRFVSGAFIVPAGNLSTSVAIFSACAIIAILLLFYRRKVAGGELGGSKSGAYVSAGLISLLWVVYIVLSIVDSVP